MITDVRVSPYDCDGQYGTIATYIDERTGLRMSARFSSIMSIEGVRMEISRRRQALRMRSVS